MFTRTRRALDKLSLALRKTDNDKELQNYFTRQILIIFCNEFEKNLKIVLKQHLQNHSTKALSRFIYNAIMRFLEHVFLVFGIKALF